MQIPLPFLDVAAIEEIPPDLWREVFDAVGWPASLSAKRASFTHEDIVNAFHKDNLSAPLLQALETVDALGSEPGREAILAAMSDQGISTDKLPKETSEKELALRLFLAQQADASMVDVFARARIQMEETGQQRRYNEFMGKEVKPVAKLAVKSRALQERVLQYCRDNDLGDHVEVRACENDGAYIFNIIRSHHMKKTLAVVPGQASRTTLPHRPIHCDILRYEVHLGRLRVAVRATTMVEVYCRALGAVLFEDESFFEGDPVYDLAVLQEHGRAALNDHNVFGVGRIWMAECLWEHGEELLHLRRGDCFRAIERLRLPLSEGRIVQAKLKMQVIGRSTRPVTVNIRVPSRMEISQKSHERLVEQVLKAIGIRNAVPRIAANDLWSLQPLRQPVARWRALFGPELDAMVQQGVLSPIQLESIDHPEHPGAGRVLEPQATDDGAFYAVSRMPEIASRTITATDLDGLELHPEKLRQHLRTRFEITEGGTVWNGSELLDLGAIQVGDHRIHALYALRQPAAGIGDRMRALSNGAPAVLLVPASQAYDAELAKVLLNSALPKRAELIPSAIRACGLENSVPAIHLAPPDARLVVDTQLKRVWVDGIEIKGLVPDSHPYKFIEFLARNPSRASIDEISKNLSQGRQDGDATARRAKMEAQKRISQAMADAGRSFNEKAFPPDGTGFCRCALPPYVQ